MRSKSRSRAVEEAETTFGAPPVTVKDISSRTGFEVEKVRELMAEARFHGWSFYVNQVPDRDQSPIGSHDGWTVTQQGSDALASIEHPAT